MAEFRRPTNLRVTKYFSGSVGIVWDGISDKSHLSNYLVYGQRISDGQWEPFSSDADNSTIVTGPYSALKVSAILTDATETDFSNIIPISITNATDINQAFAIGQDESGQRRLIATTPEGVVKVTGATVTNTGGDSSAVKQDTQISQLNTVVDKLSDLITKTNAVLLKLGSVALDGPTLAGLATTAVNNFPVNYPDSAVAALLNNIGSIVSKDASVIALDNTANTLLKTSQLNLDGSRNLGVVITNTPSDYPDNAALAKLDIVKDKLDAIGMILSSVENTQSGDSGTIIALHAEVVNCVTSLVNIINNTAPLAALLTSGNNLSSDILGVITPIPATAQAIATNTTGLVHKSDLNLDVNKNQGVFVANTPTDYPDAAGRSELISIKNLITLLTQGCSATITQALPAGANQIGSVAVSESVLPTGAATESTLNTLGAVITYISELESEMRDLLEGVKAITNSISDKISFALAPRQQILSQTITLPENNGSASLRILDIIPGNDLWKLNDYESYSIQILTFGVAISATFRFETSVNNEIFYHTHSSISMSPGASEIINISAPIQNLSMLFSQKLTLGSGPKAVKVIITAIR